MVSHTQGHAERVTGYALGLAEGLDPDLVRLFLEVYRTRLNHPGPATASGVSLHPSVALASARSGFLPAAGRERRPLEHSVNR